VNAINDLGLKAEYVPVNDIHVNGRKVSGCAQTRKGGALLQHGTVMLKHDPSLMFSLLKVDPVKLREKGLADPAQRITSLEKELGAPLEIASVKEHMCHQFSKLLNVEFRPSTITSEEKARAHLLVKEKYSRDEWNLMR